MLESSDGNPQKLPEVPSPSPVIQSRNQLKMQLGVSFSSLFPSDRAPHRVPALKPSSQALLSSRYQADQPDAFIALCTTFSRCSEDFFFIIKVLKLYTNAAFFFANNLPDTWYVLLIFRLGSSLDQESISFLDYCFC